MLLKRKKLINISLTHKITAMNTIQAKEILIEKVLQNLGCEPIKSTENES